MKLLLVDDSIADRRLIEHALARAKIQIQASHAQSVEEANELLIQTEFDTILLSDNLPGWDAMELLLHIRSRSADRQVAIVMMSDTDNDEHTLKCIRSGAHDFLLKSEISVQRLQRAVVQATARSELELKLRQSYERVKFLAEHDALTGVANRYMFDMTLKTSVEQAKTEHTSVGLVLLNVDRFKFINDTYGHDVGDQILVELADRIGALLGSSEYLFRVGGDEFAVILTGLAYAHIGGLHQRLLYSLEEPFLINDIQLKLTVSAGVAFSPQNCETGEQLLRCADIAMYRAKQLGYNNICFVDDDAQKQFQRRFLIEHELVQAIENDEFVLHYQPVMSASRHNLVSCEALIRWQHPKHGLVFPDYFIDIAEESGQVVELGKWIIHKACQQMAKWQKDGPIDIVMALNISPQQLYDKYLVDYFDKTLMEYDLKPEQFEIEITETVLLKHTPDVLQNLQQFVERGFGLALDDFGTGFSSIQHLQSFPISTVKIDRSLMPTKNSSLRSMSLLKGLVAMINSMELSIVAEGIEDQKNAILCRELGVERLQGYHFSKPVSAQQFEQQFLFAHLMEKLAG